VLLAATAMRTTGAHDSPWETGIGAKMKAGFIVGCTNTEANAAHCGCVFSRLTAHPPYNTPDGFANLATNEQEFERTHDVNALPQAYIDAVGACRTTE
jgi:hypothetical protein